MYKFKNMYNNNKFELETIRWDGRGGKHYYYWLLQFLPAMYVDGVRKRGRRLGRLDDMIWFAARLAAGWADDGILCIRVLQHGSALLSKSHDDVWYMRSLACLLVLAPLSHYCLEVVVLNTSCLAPPLQSGRVSRGGKSRVWTKTRTSANVVVV